LPKRRTKVKCKGARTIKEVPLVNLLRADSLARLNKIFGTFYRPKKVQETARIIEQARQDDINTEIDRLMKQKPERGGYGA